MTSHGMHLSPVTLGCVESEYVRAHIKHKGWTPKNVRMSDGERLAILMEEVGEVARAITYDNGDPKKLGEELIQVATMAAAWAEYCMGEADAQRNGKAGHSALNGIRVHKVFGPESVD